MLCLRILILQVFLGIPNLSLIRMIKFILLKVDKSPKKTNDETTQ